MTVCRSLLLSPKGRWDGNNRIRSSLPALLLEAKRAETDPSGAAMLAIGAEERSPAESLSSCERTPDLLAAAERLSLQRDWKASAMTQTAPPAETWVSAVREEDEAEE